MNNIDKRDNYIGSIGVRTGFSLNCRYYYFSKISDMEIKFVGGPTYEFYINGDFMGNITKSEWSTLTDNFNLYLEAVKEYNDIMFEIDGLYYSILTVKNFSNIKIPELNDKGINCISFDVVSDCGESDHQFHLVDNDKLDEIRSKVTFNNKDDSVDSIKMFLNNCFGKSGKVRFVTIPKEDKCDANFIIKMMNGLEI